MKVKLFFFTLFSVSIAFAQKSECTVYFKDGTNKVGFIKEMGSKPGLNEKFKFRTNKKSKEIFEFKIENIAKIDFIENGVVNRTMYYKHSENNPNVFLEVILIYKNEVSLYYHYVSEYQYNNTEYYVQRGEDKLVKIFNVNALGNRSKNLMMKYFNDCPVLIEHIKKDTFKNYVKNHPDFVDKPKLQSRIIEIVKFYSTKCLENN